LTRLVDEERTEDAGALSPGERRDKCRLTHSGQLACVSGKQASQLSSERSIYDDSVACQDPLVWMAGTSDRIKASLWAFDQRAERVDDPEWDSVTPRHPVTLLTQN
jgi:hypothetical protein